MLFRRRRRLHPVQRLRAFLWPRTGWVRSWRYLMHRVVRLSDTPHAVALGFASGAALSLTPFIGFHFVLAALVAWLIGGNVLASAVGTVVGNPWTFPFIWLWIYHLGNWMLGGGGPVHDLPEDLTLLYLFEHPWRALLPMTLGGLPTAAAGFGLAYWPVRRVIERYQSERRQRRGRRAVARPGTGRRAADGEAG